MCDGYKGITYERMPEERYEVIMEGELDEMQCHKRKEHVYTIKQLIEKQGTEIGMSWA